MNEQNNRTMMTPSERLEAIFSLTLAATIAQVILSYDLVTDMIGCASFAIVGLSTATLFVILMRYFQIRVSGRQISELSFAGTLSLTIAIIVLRAVFKFLAPESI